MIKTTTNPKGFSQLFSKLGFNKSKPDATVKWKNGKFFYSDLSDGTYIERIGNSQTDYIASLDLTLTSDVNWINDNEFVLTLKHISHPEKSNYKVGEQLEVKIVDSDSNSYVAEANYYGHVFTYTILYA